jgi:hypothetical protein
MAAPLRCGLVGSGSLRAAVRVDPHEDTTLDAHQMPALIADLDSALSKPHSGPEFRGLRRLRIMAEMCQSDDALTLRFWGD